MIRKNLTRAAAALTVTATAIMVPGVAHADVNVGDVNVASGFTVVLHDVLNNLTALVHIL